MRSLTETDRRPIMTPPMSKILRMTMPIRDQDRVGGSVLELELCMLNIDPIRILSNPNASTTLFLCTVAMVVLFRIESTEIVLN